FYSSSSHSHLHSFPTRRSSDLLWNPKLNIYFVAAKETMKAGLLPKILAYAGSISIERTWREKGKDVNKQVKMSDVSNITNALNRSEEHTSELQSRENLVCRLLL